MAKITHQHFLKTIREQQGWSQTDFAKHLGIDRTAVSRLEAEKRRLSLLEFVRLIQALQCSPALAVALARELAGEPTPEPDPAAELPAALPREPARGAA